MQKTGKRKKRGFSILELMIAISLFITSFCMIIGIFPVTFRSVQLSKENLVATNLAEQRMEYIKSLPFDEITNTNLPPGSIVLNNKVNGVQQNLTFEYYPMVIDQTTELKRVTVKVAWTVSKLTHYVVLETQIAKLN